MPDRTVDAGEPVSDQEVPQLTVGLMGEIPQLDPVEDVQVGITVNLNAMEPLLRVDNAGEIRPLAGDRLRGGQRHGV